jgi:hypothetical protein
MGSSLIRQFWFYCPDGYAKASAPGNSSVLVCKRRVDKKDERKQPRKCGGDCNVGNPINIVLGEKYQREIDYVGAGAFPLIMERHYSSGVWRHTYDRTIEVMPVVDTPTYKLSTIWANREDGSGISFSVSAGIVQPPESEVVERLEIVIAAGTDVVNRIVVKDVLVEWRAMLLADGRLFVGSIFPVR